MYTANEIVEEVVTFSSECYRLEGTLAYPAVGEPGYAVAIAGPHPLLGGDMENNVVRGLGVGLSERGAVTLRFNYRGVGQSEGPRIDVAAQMASFWQTSHTSDESDWRHDFDAAVAFLRRLGCEMPLLLVGYSFGCAMLLRSRFVGDAVGLVMVAPTVAIHDYAAACSMMTPTRIVASEDDFASDQARLAELARSLPGLERVVAQRLDNHFFRGHEAWLADVVQEFIGQVRGGRCAPNSSSEETPPRAPVSVETRV